MTRRFLVQKYNDSVQRVALMRKTGCMSATRFLFVLKWKGKVNPMESSNEFLGTERIGKLMQKYAIPCIISLLVGALYNIVDQIFIANGHPAEPLRKAAAGILVCGDLDRAFRFAKDYWVIDGAIAAQNICLAAQELGLGAVWLGLFCCSLRRPRCSNFSI